MATNELPIDQIGIWSEIKHKIVKEYKNAYSTIMSKQTEINKHIYIDAFAGTGIHISKTTGENVKGSPLNDLEITPHFSEFHFIELNEKKI